MKSIIQQLEEDINQAQRDEQTGGEMQAYITNNIDLLHQVVKIHNDAPVTGLMHFIERYISCVPQYLDAVETLAQEAHISQFTQPFLNLAYTCFINPPDTLEKRHALKVVLPKAYLIHRMLEEINDQVTTISGTALIPVDMSTANLICVNLIGDELASQLDHLVLMGMETLNVDRQVFEHRNVTKALAKLQTNQWQSVFERWPVFKQDFGVELQVSR